MLSYQKRTLQFGDIPVALENDPAGHCQQTASTELFAPAQHRNQHLADEFNMCDVKRKKPSFIQIANGWNGRHECALAKSPNPGPWDTEPSTFADYAL